MSDKRIYIGEIRLFILRKDPTDRILNNMVD